MTKILVIEDEEALLEDIALLLSLNDYEVISAANGAEGLQKMDEEQPDIVISDVMMPHMDGHDFLRAMRQHPSMATTPLIFLTAKAEPASVRLGMELGADDYLSKPFSGSQLTRAIEAQLKKQKILAGHINQVKKEAHQELFHFLPHEINTPLNGILGLAQLLKLEDGCTSREDLLTFTDHLIQSSNRLHHTLGNMMLSAQISDLLSQPEKINSMRQHVCDNVRLEIVATAQAIAEQSDREQDFTIEVAEAKGAISDDDMRKIATELVSNALKFSAENTPIHIQGTVEDEHYVLTVSDEGRGMSSAEIAAVGPYQQFQRKYYEQQGSGLGLAIVSGLLDIYAGSLTIEPNSPNGLRVVARIPLAS